MQKKRKLEGTKGLIRMLEGSLEIILLTVLYYIFWRNGYDEGNFPAYYGNGKYILCGIYALLVTVLFNNMDGFKFGYLKMVDALISQLIALFIADFITYWQLSLIANEAIRVAPIFFLFLAQILVVLLCTYVFTAVYHMIYASKNMVMLYGSNNAITLKFKMECRDDKYRINKLIPVDRGMDYICREIVKYDAVIINDVHAQIRNDILKFCYANKIRAYVTPKLSDIIVRGATNISLFDTPLLLVRSRGLTFTQRVLKRFMDLTLCLIAMIPAAPIMLAIAIAIKLDDGGPVFYKQTRVTLNGKKFDILKFRSMIVNAEKDGHSIPATDRDPRITRVGNVIRALRVDELPQLLNIIKGDMSIVGPRPERVEHVEEYSKEIPEFPYRHRVKGGLTGYAQIYGKYNTSPYDKLRLDMMYIEDYSLPLDIKLILMTIRIMLKKESTEGFDKAEEMETRKLEELEKIHHDEECEAEEILPK